MKIETGGVIDQTVLASGSVFLEDLGNFPNCNPNIQPSIKISKPKRIKRNQIFDLGTHDVLSWHKPEALTPSNP